MKHLGWISAFLLGLAVGIAGPLVGPKYLMPYLPQGLQGKMDTVEGVVTRKQKDTDQLLLTVSAPRGATLVTFKEKVKEIDLLVEQQDTITLAVKEYKPFLFDPLVVQVKKPPVSSTPPIPTESSDIHKDGMLNMDQGPEPVKPVPVPDVPQPVPAPPQNTEEPRPQ